MTSTRKDVPTSLRKARNAKAEEDVNVLARTIEFHIESDKLAAATRDFEIQDREQCGDRDLPKLMVEITAVQSALEAISQLHLVVAHIRANGLPPTLFEMPSKVAMAVIANQKDVKKMAQIMNRIHPRFREFCLQCLHEGPASWELPVLRRLVESDSNDAEGSGR
jgi:hypothetical protein